jgi:hypothetical protein
MTVFLKFNFLLKYPEIKGFSIKWCEIDPIKKLPTNLKKVIKFLEKHF